MYSSFQNLKFTSLNLGFFITHNLTYLNEKISEISLNYLINFCLLSNSRAKKDQENFSLKPSFTIQCKYHNFINKIKIVNDSIRIFQEIKIKNVNNSLFYFLNTRDLIFSYNLNVNKKYL